MPIACANKSDTDCSMSTETERGCEISRFFSPKIQKEGKNCPASSNFIVGYMDMETDL